MSKKNKTTKQATPEKIIVRMVEGEVQNFQVGTIGFSPFDTVRCLVDDGYSTYFVLGDTLSAFGVKNFGDPIYRAIDWKDIIPVNFVDTSGNPFYSLEVIPEEVFMKLATECKDPKAQAFRKRAFDRLIATHLE